MVELRIGGGEHPSHGPGKVRISPNCQKSRFSFSFWREAAKTFGHSWQNFAQIWGQNFFFSVRPSGLRHCTRGGVSTPSFWTEWGSDSPSCPNIDPWRCPPEAVVTRHTTRWAGVRAACVGAALNRRRVLIRVPPACCAHPCRTLAPPHSDLCLPAMKHV